MAAPPAPAPPPAHALPLPAPWTWRSGVRVLGAVPYAAIPGVRPLELDLYLPPAGAAPVPVVIFLHGGGWRLGSRRSAGPAYVTAAPSPFEQLAAAGIAVASVDYRLSGETIWPAQLHDAKAAVRWVRARAEEIGVDPHRIAAWGESAGGQLALMLGLTGAELDGQVGLVGPASTVAAVVAWYAPSDLAGLPDDLGGDPADAGSREAQLLGAPLSKALDHWSAASPINHVGEHAPPMLLLHGEADRLIPCVQTRRLAAALAEVDAPVEVAYYPDADHMWLGAPEAAGAALRSTIDFLLTSLDQNLR